MGQKCNPNIFRAPRKVSSVWYTEKSASYGKLVISDYMIRTFIEKSFPDAMISSIEIRRLKGKVSVVVHAHRALSIVKSKKGVGVETIRDYVSKIAQEHSNEKPEVFVAIEEVRRPEADATLMAIRMAKQIEERVPAKRVLKNYAQMIQKHATGLRMRISGRIQGVQIARKEEFHEGSVPLHTIDANIDYGQHEALTTFGKIGIKVWIYNNKKKSG